MIDRLPDETITRLRSLLFAPGLHIRERIIDDSGLRELRQMYESYIYSLAERLLLPLPPWMPETSKFDNWQISAWGPKPSEKEHF